jgi:hypothetical protein
VQSGGFRSGRPGVPAQPPGPGPAAARCEPAEAVLPVIGCTGWCGASTLALALATAAGTARVVECCTAPASGLAAASTAELGRHDPGWLRGSRDAVLIERADAVLLGVDEVPLPADPARPVRLTVLDVGWELAQVLATRPSWLGEAVTAAATVVAVATATVPGLRRLEAALCLLQPGAVAAVVRPRRRQWAPGVARSMGSRTVQVGSARG